MADSVDELRGRLEAVATENFSRAIGQLVRAIDEWESGKGSLQRPNGAGPLWPEDGPPAYALEARDAVIRHMEWLAEEVQR